MEKIKINIIKTDKEICFISDCSEVKGYDYEYHRTKLTDYLFDGEKPLLSNHKNWYKLNKYPEKIQKYSGDRIENPRYEIKDKKFLSEALPEVIEYKDSDNYDEDILNSLYNYKTDKVSGGLLDIDYELYLVCEITNYEEPPVFDYNGIRKSGWDDKKYKITNKDIEHSFAHKVFMPAPLLPTVPCRLSSKEVYDITRQYIKDNIDLAVAKITSDYDFCFAVRKIIPLIEPETVTYQNYFARTKKERNKIHFLTKEYKEKEIFQMTHTQSNYNNYTPIKEIEAENEWELKEKIDTFLNDLITIINKPLSLCPHCSGGYIEGGENGK